MNYFREEFITDNKELSWKQLLGFFYNKCNVSCILSRTVVGRDFWKSTKGIG